MDDNYGYLFDNDQLMVSSLRRQRVFRDRYNPFDWMDDQYILENYRFDRESIFEITRKISAIIGRSNRGHNISPLISVLTALKFFANGSSIRTIAEQFGVAKTTVASIIHSVARAISVEYRATINFADNQENLRERKSKFKEIAGFPNVIGAIDGTLIPIQRPSTNEHLYVCRKNFHAINLLAVCDADLIFLFVNCKYPGSANDSFIFRDSVLISFLSEGRCNGVLLGDSAFPLKMFLMTPFLHPSSAEMESYNFAHTKTRNTIERAFGVLKSRFRCLDKSGKFSSIRSRRMNEL